MGGTKTTIQQAQPPDVSQTSEDLYKARLKYDLPIAQQEMGIQQQMLPQQTALQNALVQQYYPQLSQLYTNVQAQQMPQLQALQQQLYPQQSQILEQGAGNVLSGLQSQNYQQLQQQSLQQALSQLQQPQSPLQQQLTQQALSALGSGYGITPEQQAAQEAIRGREIQRTQMLARGRGQLSGGLFGGRNELMEQGAMTELGQKYATEDIDRIEQMRQQAIQNALGISGQNLQSQQQSLASAFAAQQQYANMAQPYLNILYPQAQQAGQVQTSPFQFQGVTPSADNYFSNLSNIAGQNAYAMPGQASPWAEAAGSGMGILSAKLFMACIPEGTIIDIREGQKKVEDIKTGDIILDKNKIPSKVLMKYEFDEPPTNNKFLELDFNGVKLVICDTHELNGVKAINLNVPKKFVSMNTRSYDLLTNGKDGSYMSNGIGIDSMIPKLHQLAKEELMKEKYANNTKT